MTKSKPSDSSPLASATGGGASAQEDSQSLQFFHFDGRKRAEMDGKNPRPDLFHGSDLLLQLWRIRRGDRLRWRQSALGVIAGHGGERRALRRRLDRLRLRRDERLMPNGRSVLSRTHAACRFISAGCV